MQFWAVGTSGVKLFSLFYFAEALLLGDWMARRGRTHLHAHFSTAVAGTVGLLTSVAWEISYSLSVHGTGRILRCQGIPSRSKRLRMPNLFFA